jgi:FKBP-type peptidyl-prolyl cis-trans isomerase
MRLRPLSTLVFCLVGAAAHAADPLLSGEGDRLDYLLGYQAGLSYRSQGFGLSNPDALVRGIRDAIEDRAPLMSFEEMQRTFLDAQRARLARLAEARQRELDRRREEGRAFLAENARREGVMQLPSGLQYRVLEEGRGASPGTEDGVSVNYRGTLIDGTEFDSSHRRGGPVTFALNTVIPGWSEGVQLMKEGGRQMLYIPADLAYGDEGELAGQTLLFEVELLRVEKGADNAAP